MRGAVQAWPALGGSQTFTNVTLSGNLSVGGTSTFTGNVVSNLLFTDATYDIGASGATRPRDGFFSRNLVLGGTVTSGKVTISTASGPAIGITQTASGEQGFNVAASHASYAGTMAVVAATRAASSAFDFLTLTANSVEQFGVSGAGLVRIAADRSLTLTNQTSSAAAQTGTLTNAPAAGNPGFWLKIKIGGVDYAVPCWAG